MPATGVELELKDGVGPVSVVAVRKEDKLVESVGLNSMSANGRFQAFGCWTTYRSVLSIKVYCRMGALIIGGQ